MELTVSRAVVSVVSLWIFQRIIKKWLAVRYVVNNLLDKECPGRFFHVFHPFRDVSNLVGIWFPRKGTLANVFAGFLPYRELGSTILSGVSSWPGDPQSCYWLADAEAVKAVTNDRTNFPKELQPYVTLQAFGDSVVVLEGSEWKRHRSILNPAFNDANMALVWKESINTANEWFSLLDTELKTSMDSTVTIDLNHAYEQIALAILCAAAFGRRAPIVDTSEIPPGQVMQFKTAVLGVGRYFVTYFVSPNWLVSLTKFIHIPWLSPHVQAAVRHYSSLRSHMVEIISQSRAEKVAGESTQLQSALLRNLVTANMTIEAGKSLTDDELLGNTFIFLFAGHDTNSHTMAVVTCLLALHPEVQTKIYEEARSLWPNGFPTEGNASAFKEGVNSLKYTTAAFHEALRLFPVTGRLGKRCMNGAVLKRQKFSQTNGGLSDVEPAEVHIAPGSMVVIDVPAVQKNPLHWGEDAEKFKPERFIDTATYRWPRDAFLAFSAGARSCIGQRFATIEAACIIAGLVQNYEILVPKNVEGLPWKDQYSYLTTWLPLGLNKPTNAFVRFRRRKV